MDFNKVSFIVTLTVRSMDDFLNKFGVVVDEGEKM